MCSRFNSKLQNRLKMGLNLISKEGRLEDAGETGAITALFSPSDASAAAALLKRSYRNPLDSNGDPLGSYGRPMRIQWVLPSKEDSRAGSQKYYLCQNYCRDKEK